MSVWTHRHRYMYISTKNENYMWKAVGVNQDTICIYLVHDGKCLFGQCGNHKGAQMLSNDTWLSVCVFYQRLKKNGQELYLYLFIQNILENVYLAAIATAKTDNCMYSSKMKPPCGKLLEVLSEQWFGSLEKQTERTNTCMSIC